MCDLIFEFNSSRIELSHLPIENLSLNNVTMTEEMKL